MRLSRATTGAERRGAGRAAIRGARAGVPMRWSETVGLHASVAETRARRMARRATVQRGTSVVWCQILDRVGQLGLEILISASRQRAANPTKEKRLTATLDSPRHTRSRRMLASRLTSLVRVSSAFRVHRRRTVEPPRATRARTRVRSRGSRRPGRAEASFSLCRVPSSSETASGPLPA